MVVRNLKLGGTNWAEEGLRPTDINDTFDATIDEGKKVSIGVAQNAYQILQANDVFENKDALMADEYVDADGTNGTVNTGSSTALFETDKYICDIVANGINDDENFHGTTFQWTASTTNSLGLEITVDDTCFLREFIKGALTTSTRAILRNSSGAILATATFSGTVATFSPLPRLSKGEVYFVEQDNSGSTYTYDYDGAYIYFDQSKTFITYTDETINGVAQNLTRTNSTLVGLTVQGTDYLTTPFILVHDTNLPVLDGTETGIVIYGDATTPTNTSINIDVSDSTLSVLANPLTKNTTGVIDVTSLGAGQLKITKNLTTTDTSVTPSTKGLSAYIIR